MFFIASAVISLFACIITIIMSFSDEDSYIFRMFGDTEIYFLMGVAFVLLMLGIIIDKRKELDKE